MSYRLPTFKKKNRMMRGQGGGYGGKKKHRGKGSRGGKGWAGSTKHRRSYVYKYAPENFGYKGFRPPAPKAIKIINLKDVEKLAKGKDIDLTKLGYTKLLGNGKLSKPLTITIGRVSASAKAAVEAAGGTVIVKEFLDTRMKKTYRDVKTKKPVDNKDSAAKIDKKDAKKEE